MKVNTRKVYEPAFKVAVLDEVDALSKTVPGATPIVALRRKLDAGLVYSWKAKEKEIRKMARKLAPKTDAQSQAGKQASKQAGLTLAEIRKKPEPEPLPDPESSPESGPVERRPKLVPAAASDARTHSDEGPLLTVHALGPWLTEALRRELPAAIGKEVAERLEVMVPKLVQEHVELAVRAELARFIHKGVGAS